MKILVTGGTGYIGSHWCRFAGTRHGSGLFDNGINSDQNVLKSIEEITGKKSGFYPNDLCDNEATKHF